MPILRGLILLIVALACALPAVADAYQVLLLISSRDKVYQEAVSGLRQGRDFSDRVIFLSDYAEADLARTIREDRPHLIAAVGDRALAAARKVRQIPVVSLMAVSFHRIPGSTPNITGVDLFIRPEHYMNLFAAMKLSRVGVLYDPEKSGYYLKKALQQASKSGIELLPKVVKSSEEVVGQLAKSRGEMDAIWMIPDASAVSHQSAEAYFLFSMRQQVPVISFSSSHLRLGAAVVIEADQEEMGRQAGEMVRAILQGTPVSELPPTTPRKIMLKVNQRVLNHLGIPAAAIMRLPNFSKE